MSELAEKSKAFYERELKTRLEATEKGKFVAIEPETESYFVDKDGTKALLRARAAFPDKLFFLIRIGYEAAHSIGGYGYKRNG
jgi:catechol 2,3-dioxygenase-like lactoylglutathione lyase family enzyme